MNFGDWFPPDEWEVKKFFRAIEFSKGPVYVHCLHGKDRTGFVCAAYQMVYNGMSFKDAVKEMYDFGFHKWPYFWWVRSLKKYEKKK